MAVGSPGGGGRTPPATRRSEQVDDYHGEMVADPYRWLEDSGSVETAEWVRRQNDYTESFLSAVPSRAEIHAQLREIWDFPTFGVPFERGGRWFQERNSGLQDQSVYYVMGSPDGDGLRLLLDPNEFSPDGSSSVAAIAVSDDGTLFAYAVSEAGSDWATWRVRDVASGQDLADVVRWCKNPHAAWARSGSGFYYSGTEPPAAGDQSAVGVESIFFHALGTGQSEDTLLFAGEGELLPEVSVTDDGRFVVVSVTVGTAPEARVEVLDLDRTPAGLQPLVGDFSSVVWLAGNDGATFYAVTDDGAPWHRLVAIDSGAPRRSWREIVPETGAVLTGARLCGGRLVCHYLEDACSRLRIFELDGRPVREVALPAVASVGPYYGTPVEGHAQKRLFQFEVRSFAEPGSTWSHDVMSGETMLLQRSAPAVGAMDIVSEQVFVLASDGEKLPLFLTRRRDVAPNGDVPTVLYGYGGFNIPVTPEFSRADVLFVQRGGLLAVACVRGGGEYGRPWYDSGRLAKKQRVFDDFADCARWLGSSGWTRPARIAMHGGSNGGLLVAACLLQHPELIGAAVPEVGVLDMLRYHLFTRGWAWKSDFGDPDDPEEYRWLRAYSPLHNIEPGICPPPTFVTTGDHDDRVVPLHSYKFVAALQAAQACDTPVLLRIETATGHGHGKPTSKAIAERADVLAFLDATIGAATPATTRLGAGLAARPYRKAHP